MLFANETQFHAWCYEYFHNKYPHLRGRLFHVQQKAMNVIEGNKFKAMGVVQGVSDFIFVGIGMVAFLELKWKAGSQSAPQRDFEKMCHDSGLFYAVIKTPDEWKTILDSLCW
jgi:hypothetical protein